MPMKKIIHSSEGRHIKTSWGWLPYIAIIPVMSEMVYDGFDGTTQPPAWFSTITPGSLPELSSCRFSTLSFIMWRLTVLTHGKVITIPMISLAILGLPRSKACLGELLLLPMSTRPPGDVKDLPRRLAYTPSYEPGFRTGRLNRRDQEDWNTQTCSGKLRIWKLHEKVICKLLE